MKVSDDEEVEEEESEDIEDNIEAGPEPTAGDAIAESDNTDEEMLDINEEQLAGMIRSILSARERYVTVENFPPNQCKHGRSNMEVEKCQRCDLDTLFEKFDQRF